MSRRAAWSTSARDTYALFLSDENGCLDSVTVDIVEPDPLAVRHYGAGRDLHRNGGWRGDHWDHWRFWTHSLGICRRSGGCAEPLRGGVLGFSSGYSRVHGRLELHCRGRHRDGHGGGGLLYSGYLLADFRWHRHCCGDRWAIADPIQLERCSANQTTATAIGLPEDVYSVTVTDNIGCTLGFLATVDPTEDCLFIADALTPNGDGINDRWVVGGLEFYPQSEVEVFNRWGQLIFRSKPGTTWWDGTYNGALLPASDYYYVISVEPGSTRSQEPLQSSTDMTMHTNTTRPEESAGMGHRQFCLAVDLVSSRPAAFATEPVCSEPLPRESCFCRHRAGHFCVLESP